jgi:flagellar biosynthesis protein FlhF
MKLRLFTGADTAQAIAAARAALGPEALVLDRRRVRGGVEITAALERDGMDAPEGDTPSEMLARHGVPEPLAGILTTSPLALPSRLRFGALPEGPLMLVGPPGGGKTLAAIRLAMGALLAGHSPRVAGVDTRRAGGELAALLAVLGLAPHPDPTTADIIDTAGIDIFDRASHAELPELRATSVLVLPADLDSASAAETARCWREWGCTHLIATRLDLAPRMGALLAAADAGLVLTLGSLTPATGAAMTPLTAAFLARRLARAPTRRHQDA